MSKSDEQHTKNSSDEKAGGRLVGSHDANGDSNKIKSTDATKTTVKTKIKNATADYTRTPSSDNTVFSNKEQLSSNTSNTSLQEESAKEGEHKTRIRQTEDRDTSSISASIDEQTQILKGRFILEQVLGKGGMGVVYKAKDLLKVEAQDRDPYVAIKVLSEEFKTHPEAFIALQRESRKTQRIAHPNTVKVYDFDRDGDVVFMTMEYMQGKPLDQLIRQYHETGLPRDDVWDILLGMCLALIHAHSENIVHSDFKPGNVYVTNNGMAKVLDFGIARAVANIDRQTGRALDRTVFDASSLGALTPAYASREMLLGKTPDTRDDIYALGCIAYEMFTGEHPFNRLPADEAYNKDLRPKRIIDISKRQWKAIEAALSFKREDRIESVEEFYRQLTSKSKTKYILAASVLLVTGTLFFMYTQVFDTSIFSVSQSEIRDELEFKIRYKIFKEEIEKLLVDPGFSHEWEENLWSEMKGISEIFSGESDEWYVTTREKIYRLYLNKVREVMSQQNYDSAKTLIENAYRYTDDSKLLDNEKIKLAEAIQILEDQGGGLDIGRTQIGNKNATQSAKKKNNYNSFNVALSNVNRQLKCSSKLNMRDFKIAISKLRSLNFGRYKKYKAKLSKKLAQCIIKIGKHNPEHALDSKRSALRIFKNDPRILSIVIKARDTCDLSISGLGGRGNRAVCRDKLQGGRVSPTMVVIPGNSRMEPFAIGKYEVSFSEFKLFCSESKKCNTAVNQNGNLPATNINISTVSAYIRWLSKKSGKKYRLPTKQEWIYAAKSKSYVLDPNRNCQLSTRGIEKGNELVRTGTGKQNSWGLVNYAGNAQEFVYDIGRKLVAAGGSYKSSMEACTATTVISHSGNPDELTGFRVARDLVDN